MNTLHPEEVKGIYRVILVEGGIMSVFRKADKWYLVIEQGNILYHYGDIPEGRLGN